MTRAAARLRLATLVELEDSHSQLAGMNRRQPIPESAVGRDAQAAAEARQHHHSHVAQRKYNLDASTPAWKMLVFHRVYLPLFRFFHKRLGFITPDMVEERPDGSYTYSWLEHQGCFFNEAEAREDAKRYPFGFVVPNLPLGRSLPADTVTGQIPYYPDKRADLALLETEVRKLGSAIHAARIL
jgi:hypothetical protein